MVRVITILRVENILAPLFIQIFFSVYFEELIHTDLKLHPTKLSSPKRYVIYIIVLLINASFELVNLYIICSSNRKLLLAHFDTLIKYHRSKYQAQQFQN